MMAQVSGLPGATLSQMENSAWIFVVLEIIFLHERKEEGMTLDDGKRLLLCPTFVVVLLCWHPTSFFVWLYCCVGIQPVFLFVLLCWHPTSFFVRLYCCVGIQPLNSRLQWWHPPWCSEGEIIIRLEVTCKQLSVLATLVIVFEKLFYHFQFEYQILK